jgi:hypothetical protein
MVINSFFNLKEDHSHMAVPAKIHANRANAARSTGPRTAAGKARSCFNSLKHGLYARDVVLPGENRAEYDKLRADLIAELRPHGRYEIMLVERLADISWRLGRAAAIEAGLLNRTWGDDGPPVDTFRIALDESERLDQLGRYEYRLARAFDTVTLLLKHRQAWRRQEGRHQEGRQRTATPTPTPTPGPTLAPATTPGR